MMQYGDGLMSTKSCSFSFLFLFFRPPPPTAPISPQLRRLSGCRLCGTPSGVTYLALKHLGRVRISTGEEVE